MLIQLALSLLTAPASPPPLRVPPSDRPKVELWTSRGSDPYPAGEAVRVSFQTDQDAYVTVLRVDTDGRVRVLFPREPWENNFASGGRVYEVRGVASSAGFRADDYPGEGYLFAVAAADPFAYDPIVSGERWNYALIAEGGRIRGDPYAALTEIAERIVLTGSSDWDYDIAPYYVQQHYEYPRFLCYDCHAYVSFRSWNPYDYSCVRFRIVVFDDPYYYPYRAHGGTRAVFRRPFRPEPRFIFKDRRGSDPFVTRVRERPVNDNRRREVGVRGRDIGGPGTVPPPRGERGSFARPDRSRRPDYPVRPSQPARPSYPDRPTRREGYGQSDRARPSPSTPQRRPDETRAPQTRRPSRSAESARPRQTPRAEPSRGSQRDRGRRSEPELRRRKP